MKGERCIFFLLFPYVHIALVCLYIYPKSHDDKNDCAHMRDREICSSNVLVLFLYVRFFFLWKFSFSVDLFNCSYWIVFHRFFSLSLSLSLVFSSIAKSPTDIICVQWSHECFEIDRTIEAKKKNMWSYLSVRLW